VRGCDGLKPVATFGTVCAGLVGMWLARGGGVAVFGVGGDTGGDGLAPVVGAEGGDVFVLRETDGLGQGLEHEGDGARDARFNVAAEDSGDEARQCGAEIVSGEIVAGEKVGEVFAYFFGGFGAGFLLSVIETEMGMVGGARGAAAAAILVVEETEWYAVVGI